MGHWHFSILTLVFQQRLKKKYFLVVACIETPLHNTQFMIRDISENIFNIRYGMNMVIV